MLLTGLNPTRLLQYLGPKPKARISSCSTKRELMDKHCGAINCIRREKVCTTKASDGVRAKVA